MNNSIAYMEKPFKGHSLIDLGYRDYIAARFSFNNQFIIQGLTLASTSVEKYLKALIVLNLKEREKYNYHFDGIFMALGQILKIFSSDAPKPCELKGFCIKSSEPTLI